MNERGLLQSICDSSTLYDAQIVLNELLNYQLIVISANK